MRLAHGRVLLQRVLVAAVGIPLLVAVVAVAPGWLFAGLVLLVGLVAQGELYRMFGQLGVVADAVLGLLLGGIVVLAFAGGAGRPWLAPLALSLAVACTLAVGLRRVPDGADLAGLALTLLGICYCAWLLGHAIWLRALPGGPALVLLALGVTWCGETAAYFVGRRWGTAKLAPRISPAKTVEGAIAQLAASIAAAAAGAVLLPGLRLAPVHAVAIGVVLGVLGQVGDLAESFLKRSAGRKDASALLPGHGGLLDRLDSLLFNLPALYYYVRLLALPPPS